MRPNLKLYEQEEDEIDADYAAGHISKSERDKAMKELWDDYNQYKSDYIDELLEEDF